ncbi:hypothetical protein [Photobacterium kasasachensis]|uniref:hypothetical protein n=1 Tax=Photobacterium kasasachensis TaxID=2910240 RepID=UPI003D126414
MRKISLISLLCLGLFGCNGDNGDELPSTEFSGSYKLSDFTLNENYAYWEVRQGNMSHQESSEDIVLNKFDDDIYSNLSTEQVNLLAEADTNYGFDSRCAPMYCPIYGVAILGTQVTLIESNTDLISFFGEVDTEAELSYLLSVGYANAKYYEKNEIGYKVIIEWDNLCGTRGENLIQVHKNGTVELLKELSTEEYQGCV